MHMYKYIKARTQAQAGVHAPVHAHSSALSSKSNKQFEQGGQVLHGLTGPKCFKEAAERCSMWKGFFFSAQLNHSL